MSDIPKHCAREECDVCDRGIAEWEDAQPYKRPPLGFLKDEDKYPTEWQVREGFAREEWRQLSVGTYEVRNPESILTLSWEEWEHYNKGAIEYLKYLNDHSVDIRDRDDG